MQHLTIGSNRAIQAGVHRRAMAAAGTLLLAGASALALAPQDAQAADVGVSISVSQPGVYGRVDIGRFPQPVVYAPQPVVVHQPPPTYTATAQPVYMWVPPGHRKKWNKHCARYNACGVPVYFVQDGWYRQHVAPQPVMHPPVMRPPVVVHQPAPVVIHQPPPVIVRQPAPVVVAPAPGYAPPPGWRGRPGDGEHPGRGHGHGRGEGRGENRQ